MTVKQLITELQQLPKELQNKPVYTYEPNGEMSNPEVKALLKNSYNPLDKRPKNVLGFFIG